MSSLFTDPHRKCVACGKRAGVWPHDDDGVATCPTCGKRQERATHDRGANMNGPKGICAGCGVLIEARDKAAYQVTGYEQERDQGGANHIVDRRRVDRQIWHDRYHGDCLDVHRYGGHQETLGV